jgi:cell division protein FtsZ
MIDDSLGETIRITVIAAGFDRFDNERGAGGTRRREPTPARDGAPAAEPFGMGGRDEPSEGSGGDDDEFDVPEFLR